MATIDLSRHATNFAKHYTGGRLAQGQVLSDDDFNDAANYSEEDLRRTRVDVIGAAGTPDGGFKVTSPIVVGGRCSFTLKAGSFYLGGLRLALEADEAFHLQRDWLQQSSADRPPPPAAGTSRFDAVYLETFQVPVSGTEDGELMEPAFGGAPPASRLRTVRRVRVETDVGVDDCKAAWATVASRWAALGSLQPDAELKPDAVLQVTYGGAGSPLDLCAPGAVLGFLGAYNQAIRVQILPGNRLVWGYDNAAKIYRVRIETLGVARRRIRFLTQPKDAPSRPLAGQIIEILPWSAALANRLKPDGTLDRCEKTAEVAGHLAIVESSYNPGDQTLTLALPDAVPAGFGEAWKDRVDQSDLAGGQPDYYFLRVWDQGEGPAGPKSLPFVANTPVPLGASGLSVTLKGTQFPPDTHWIIAARPETADQVIPWQFDNAAGRAPQGLRVYRTPLAIVQWTTAGGTTTGTVVDDCRPPFLPLTKIGGCCRVTVGDGSTSFGHFTSIKDALAALPPAGGEICVLAGHYVENVDLKGREAITIHGCGPRTVVESAVDAAGAGVGPVFDITDAKAIRITDMAIIAHGQQPGIFAAGTSIKPSNVHMADLSMVAGPRCAIELTGGRDMTIIDCEIVMRNEAGPWPAIYSGGDDVRIEHNRVTVTPDLPLRDALHTRARGGIQLGGGSARVRVIDNLIKGGIGNGITLGSLIRIDGQDNQIIFWFIDPNDPCDPCKPGDVVVILLPGEAEKLRSAGDLYDILIERNRIFDMGLNGIGVFGFFDLTQAPLLIVVHNLRILGNVIRHCLNRELAIATKAARLFMGYGAIALAECQRLLIRDNDLVENGLSHLDPVCGVFVLLGTSLEISNNRIEENGPRSDEPSEDSRPGYRSGIHIGLALPQMVEVQTPEVLKELASKSRADFKDFRRVRGANALRIHNNVVNQPVGRSLTAAALGHVSVAENTLTSRGVPGRDLFHILVPNILVVGLGVTNELGFSLLFKLFKESRAFLTGKPVFEAKFLEAACAEMDDPPPIDLYPGYFIPGSKVTFSANRCAMDMMGEPMGFFGAPIVVASSDDLAFGSNQCELDVPLQSGLTHAVLGAMTVRCHDNRFAETRKHVASSGLISGLMNATTNNQSTHCLLPFAPVQTTLVNTGNRALIELFCGAVCSAHDQPPKG